VPTTPSGIRAVAASPNQVAVSWQTASRAAHYRVYRNQKVVQTALTTTSTTDYPVAPDTSYAYSVAACNSNGCSPNSPTVKVKTPSGSGGPTPATPTGLTAVAVDATHVSLRWTSTWKATSYNVYRDGSPLVTVSTNAYQDADVAPSSTHSYAVSACASSCSAPSSPVEVTTPALPTATPGGLSAGVASQTDITVGWDPVAGATQYHLYRDGSDIVTVAGTSYEDTTVPARALHFYAISACTSTGCSAPSSPMVVRTPPPAPTCSGVVVSPTGDLPSVVRAKPAGTTFCLQSGFYPVSGTGVLVRPNDRIIGQPGTVLDGGGTAEYGIYGYGTDTGQNDVLVEGLTLRNFGNRAIKAGWDWTIADNEITNSRVGVAVNSGTILQDNFIHDNWQYGIAGGPATNILIEGNEVAHNNTSAGCGGSCEGDSGGSKIIGSSAGTTGLVWRGNWVHDNIGAGIWSDIDVKGAIYENNLVQGNTGAGMFYEVSWNGVIRNNVAAGNATRLIGKGCGWGGQIRVLNSRNVQVYGNTVLSRNGANAVCVSTAVRTDASYCPTSSANVSVHDNVMVLDGEAQTGYVGTAPYQILFDRDTYYVSDLTAKRWDWLFGVRTWDEFQTYGQEPAGVRTAG
jgi:parallel beta-helix repeat protein